MIRRFFEKKALKKVGGLQSALQNSHGIQTYYNQRQLDQAMEDAGFSGRYAHFVYARYMDEREFKALSEKMRSGRRYSDLHSLVVGSLLAQAAMSVPAQAGSSRAAHASDVGDVGGYGGNSGGGDFGGGDCGGGAD